MGKEFNIKNINPIWYVIILGVGYFVVRGAISLIQKEKNKSSDFVGTTEAYFKKPYTKAKDESGFSKLYKLGEFDKRQVGEIRNFEQFDILGVRVLDKAKYFNIFADEWIEEENLIIPKGYKY